MEGVFVSENDVLKHLMLLMFLFKSPMSELRYFFHFPFSYHPAQLIRWLLMLLVSVSALSIEPAMAHQQKETYSTLSFNTRSKSLEIVHRFYVHDAEHALGQMLGKKVDLIKDKKAQQAFGTYIDQHFQLKTLSAKQPLKIHFIGQEVEGRYLWVYQEVPQFTRQETLHGQTHLPKPHGLKIKMNALQELWRRQVNQINIETADKVVPSIRIKQRDEWRTLYF